MGAQQSLRDLLLPQGHDLEFRMVFADITIDLDLSSQLKIDTFNEVY